MSKSNLLDVEVRMDYHDRYFLDQLIDTDLRQPAQVFRWLLREEAERRNLKTLCTHSENVEHNTVFAQ